MGITTLLAQILLFILCGEDGNYLKGLVMKTKIVGIAVLVLIALGSIGCSSSSRVWYVGDKAYAKNPETGKMMSWEYKVSEGGGWGYGAEGWEAATKRGRWLAERRVEVDGCV